MTIKSKNQTNQKPYQCEFCERSFVREKSLINHLCEQKRRWFMKDEPHARIGFHSWLRWYELSSTNAQRKRKRTYEEFMKSRYFIAFVKFGQHVVDTGLINPDQFIDFVIKNSIRLDDWCKSAVYEYYIKQYVRKENVTEAMERVILLMEDWSIKTGEEWYDFFRKVEPAEALTLIRTGKISPWVLLNVDSSNNLLDRMTDEQLLLVDKYIGVSWWKRHFSRHKADTAFVQKTLKEYGI